MRMHRCQFNVPKGGQWKRNSDEDAALCLAWSDQLALKEMTGHTGV